MMYTVDKIYKGAIHINLIFWRAGGEEVNAKGMNDMSIKTGGSSEMAIAQVLCKINSFASLPTGCKDLQKCFQNIPGAIILHETIVRDNVGFNFYTQRFFKLPFEDLEATKCIIALTATLGAIRETRIDLRLPTSVYSYEKLSKFLLQLALAGNDHLDKWIKSPILGIKDDRPGSAGVNCKKTGSVGDTSYAPIRFVSFIVKAGLANFKDSAKSNLD
uniref:Uncharacterized protein n=1 Tax=Glossina austeni TaxID=7395 RepID=A0A1A9UWL7_GLOAU